LSDQSSLAAASIAEERKGAMWVEAAEGDSNVVHQIWIRLEIRSRAETADFSMTEGISDKLSSGNALSKAQKGLTVLAAGKEGPKNALEEAVYCVS
jgi:hypothetical protein